MTRGTHVVCLYYTVQDASPIDVSVHGRDIENMAKGKDCMHILVSICF